MHGRLGDSNPDDCGGGDKFTKWQREILRKFVSNLRVCVLVCSSVDGGIYFGTYGSSNDLLHTKWANQFGWMARISNVFWAVDVALAQTLPLNGWGQSMEIVFGENSFIDFKWLILGLLNYVKWNWFILNKDLRFFLLNCSKCIHYFCI